METSNTTTVDAAFFCDYHDPHDFIKYVLKILDNNVRNWRKLTMYANYTSVIQASGMEYLLSSYDELHYVAYFIACLDKLAETPGISSIDWYHLQIARESNYISQEEDAQKFWQDIISRMEKLKSTFKNADPTAILWSSYNNVIKIYPKICGITMDKNILRICFVFDESQCLLKVGPKIGAGGQDKIVDKNNAFNNM
nr:46_t:CDS:2 [Entrophospora candida]